MHEHVVGGEDLGQRRQGDTFGHAGRARGVQPGGLVPCRGVGTVGRRRTGARQLVEGQVGGDDTALAAGWGRDGHDQGGLMAGPAEGVGHVGGERGVVDVGPRPAVVEDVGRLPGREAEVDRGGDGTEALRGQVEQGELRAVVQLEGDHVAGAHATGGQAGGDPVDVGAELGVGPAPAAGRIVQRQAGGITVHVAAEPGKKREVVLEDRSQRRGVVGVRQGQGFLSDRWSGPGPATVRWGRGRRPRNSGRRNQTR